MTFKDIIRFLPENKKTKITTLILSTILIVVILASLYLSYAWNRYKQMAEAEAMQLAQSVGSLLYVEHIEALALNDQTEIWDSHPIEQALTHLVEVTDSIYYAYILKLQNENISVVVDSSAAGSATSHPTKRSCEETEEINRLPFETGQSIITNPISTHCGDWVRTLVPILGTDNETVIAVLGLSYPAAQWQTNLWKKMIPDILVVICLALLIFMLFNLFWSNLKLKKAEQSRRESERSKSVFFSQIPGMVYQCRNDENWTMKFVSEGCYTLTGYKAESLIANEKISILAKTPPK